MADIKTKKKQEFNIKKFDRATIMGKNLKENIRNSFSIFNHLGYFEKLFFDCFFIFLIFYSTFYPLRFHLRQQSFHLL